MSDDTDTAIRAILIEHGASDTPWKIQPEERAIWTAATNAALERALRAVEAVHVTRKENGQLGYNAVMDCAAAIRALKG